MFVRWLDQNASFQLVAISRSARVWQGGVTKRNHLILESACDSLAHWERICYAVIGMFSTDDERRLVNHRLSRELARVNMAYEKRVSASKKGVEARAAITATNGSTNGTTNGSTNGRTNGSTNRTEQI
jgi:hypothetical protein